MMKTTTVKKSTCFALCAALLPAAASAQTIYKCTDAGGGTVISNTRVEKNCKVITSGPANTVPVPATPKAKATAAPTPSGFPRVGDDTQKARDGDRRHILEQELAGEQRSLEQAKKDLAEQEAARTAPDRLAPYRERIAQHERNLAAIQKELGNLR